MVGFKPYSEKEHNSRFEVTITNTTTTKTIKCHFFHFDVFISILIGSQATLLTTYWCLDCWRFIFTAGTGTGLGGRMRFFSGSWSRMTPESAVH